MIGRHLENSSGKTARFQVACLAMFIEIVAQFDQRLECLLATRVHAAKKIEGRRRPFQHIRLATIIQADQVDDDGIGKNLGKFSDSVELLLRHQPVSK